MRWNDGAAALPVHTLPPHATCSCFSSHCTYVHAFDGHFSIKEVRYQVAFVLGTVSGGLIIRQAVQQLNQPVHCLLAERLACSRAPHLARARAHAPIEPSLAAQLALRLAKPRRTLLREQRPPPLGRKVRRPSAPLPDGRGRRAARPRDRRRGQPASLGGGLQLGRHEAAWTQRAPLERSRLRVPRAAALATCVPAATASLSVRASLAGVAGLHQRQARQGRGDGAGYEEPTLRLRIHCAVPTKKRGGAVSLAAPCVRKT